VEEEGIREEGGEEGWGEGGEPFTCSQLVLNILVCK
jgi:hypothetical protein